MKVSIVMITYNHARFLRQALDGVLKQCTSFDYELVVGEDCSTDGSREIIESYVPLFQGRLKPLFRQKNLGMTKNLLDTVKHCSGEYLAFLEGDDYWICENKLQRQVEFLESHRDYVAIAHECCVVDLYGNCQKEKLGLSQVKNHEYTISNLERFELPGQTGTIVMRNLLNNLDDLIKKWRWYLWIPLDRLMVLLLLQNGRICVMDEVWSAYRHYIEDGGSNWSSNHELEIKRNYLYYFLINRRLEQASLKMGLKLDTSAQRFYFFKNAFYYGRKYKNLGCLVQSIVMFLLEKKKNDYLANSHLLSEFKYRMLSGHIKKKKKKDGKNTEDKKEAEGWVFTKSIK